MKRAKLNATLGKKTTHVTIKTKCQPAGGSRGKVKRSQKSVGFIQWGP